MAKDQVSAELAGLQDNQREIWRNVPSEPGVLASSLGRILLPPRYAPIMRGSGFRVYLPQPRIGQISKAAATASHQFRIIMVHRQDSKARQAPRKVHQLVCEAFHGPKPFAEAVVIHIDENGLNNRPENLRWGTQKENMNMPGIKAYHHSRVGERSPGAIGRARRIAGEEPQ